VRARLSICIPAYERPTTISTSIRALVALSPLIQESLQIVITDDSSSDRVERVVREELASWRGEATYRRNAERLGMAANWNSAKQAATGASLVIVHDDDYLLSAAVPSVLEYLADRPAPVTLFGARIVDANGRTIRTKRVYRERRLQPVEAVQQILSRSSFIRFPAMVVSREAYGRAGAFDATLGETADIDMWLRLCSEDGLLMHPSVFAAYRVHSGALTAGMWRRTTLEALEVIAGRVPADLVSPDLRQRLLGKFFSQFLLAGALRRLKERDCAGALRILDMFSDDLVCSKSIPMGRRFARKAMSGTTELLLNVETRRHGALECEDNRENCCNSGTAEPPSPKAPEARAVQGNPH